MKLKLLSLFDSLLDTFLANTSTPNIHGHFNNRKAYAAVQPIVRQITEELHRSSLK